MIRTFLSLVMITNVYFCNAQFYKSILPSPDFSNALEKIIIDFRLNYQTIQGEGLSKQGDVETYASTIALPGSESCVIYKFNSKVDTTASWQAVIYRGDDYKQATRTYQNVFRLVRKSRIKWIDKSLIGFSGDLEQPREDVSFAVSTLHLDLNDARYKQFQAEVELVSTYFGWEVHLNLQTKKPDYEGKVGY